MTCVSIRRSENITKLKSFVLVPQTRQRSRRFSVVGVMLTMSEKTELNSLLTVIGMCTIS